MDPNDRGIDDRDLIIGVDGQRVEEAIPDAGLRPTQNLCGPISTSGSAREGRARERRCEGSTELR
jgi:hypothetical protein